MKKLLLLSLFGVIGFLPYHAAAQINVNINIGSQPLWGPVGYDHVDNYYLPDVESYYNVQKKQFSYLEGGKWVFSPSLPARYKSYDLYHGYKVVVNSNDPYRNFNSDRVKYAKYKKMRNQNIIRDSNDPKYYVVKGHPHGTPPGLAKKNNHGMPPGQAKKYYSKENDHGNGKWKGDDHDGDHGKDKGKWKNDDHDKDHGKERD